MEGVPNSPEGCPSHPSPNQTPIMRAIPAGQWQWQWLPAAAPSVQSTLGQPGWSLAGCSREERPTTRSPTARPSSSAKVGAPGRYFLRQEGELELFGHRIVITEIIGRETPFGRQPSTDIKSRSYTASGDTLDYVYELHDNTLTIWDGYRDSDNAFHGTFSDNGVTLTGSWTWPGGGYSTTSTRARQGELSRWV